MANVSISIDTDDPSQFLRLLLQEQSSDSATSVVARHLLAHGASTSSEIVTATRLSRASISLALIDLRSRGVVIETSVQAPGKPTRGRGRPQMKQSVVAGIGFAAGVNIGLKDLRILFCDAAHNRLADITLPLGDDEAPEDVRLLLLQNLEDLADEQGTSLRDLLGVGIALAAPVSQDGIVATGSSIPQWDGLDLNDLFAAFLPCPVYADNELNCAAQSKILWGAGRGLRDFVYVSFDYTIGGAIIYDGHVRRGVDGHTAEIGHIPIDHPGLSCRCGRTGCLETLASIDAILARVSDALGRPISFCDLSSLLEEGNNAAHLAVREAAERCGQALAMISSIISPSHYLLDGNLTGLGAPFLDPMRDTFQSHTRGNPPEILDVTESFDDRVRGAAGLVFSGQGKLKGAVS